MSRERILISSVTFLISWVTVSSVQSNPIIQAAVGEPFGVARVTLQLDSREASGPISTNGYTIAESNGRIFYPAFGHTRVHCDIYDRWSLRHQSIPFDLGTLPTRVSNVKMPIES